MKLQHLLSLLPISIHAQSSSSTYLPLSYTIPTSTTE